MPNREYQSARTFASWQGLIEIAPTYSILAGGDWANAGAERKIAMAGIIIIDFMFSSLIAVSFRYWFNLIASHSDRGFSPVSKPGNEFRNVCEAAGLKRRRE